MFNHARDSLLVIGFIFCCVLAADAESLRSKLQQKTDFQPTADSPVKQLIEVAQHFELPIAIEWLDRQPASAGAKSPADQEQKTQTILKLLQTILSASLTDHQLTFDSDII